MGLIEKIAAAGVVGCGGAGFPTDRKLFSKDPVEYLIMNAAECEPLLFTDRWIMKNKAAELISALMVIQREMPAKHCVIAVKHHYEQEVASLRKAIREADAGIEIHELESYYPAGDEQAIVYEVTGRVVPPAGLPGMVGAVVDNVATVLAVYDALRDIPFTEKYLTITGEVARPMIIKAPVGTPLRECLEMAGGAKQPSFTAVLGGPMMGKVISQEEFERQVVTKTTSGVLILPPDGVHARNRQMNIRRMLNQAKSACIQCTFCTQLCPRYMLGHPLKPHMIMRKMSAAGVGTDLQGIEEILSDEDIRSAALCCECGVCEMVACPMGLRPRTINSMLKRELGKAKIRWQSDPTKVWHAREEREDRKIPSQRAAARAGVLRYSGLEIGNLMEAEPSGVEIPVHMHIGAPSVPVVQEGDMVSCGQVIARPPEGALGAVIHASISGQVTQVGNRICISRR